MTDGISKYLLEKIKAAPLEPGCYIYRDKINRVIYVGKAKSLHNRVAQYFNDPARLDAKISQLVKRIVSVEFITTDSEAEALLLENNLIKKYLPKYNKMLKDDKNYIFLMLNKQEDFPRIEIVREKKLKNARYLGPFSHTLPVRRILKEIRKLYPYRTCTRRISLCKNDSGQKIGQAGYVQSSDPNPCLYYYLGRCQAPCAGYVSKVEYNKSIKSVIKYFNNQKGELAAELEKDMRLAAKQREYERAAILRDKMNDLKFIATKIKVNATTDEYEYQKAKKAARLRGLDELASKVGITTIHPGFRMECYDISNIQGTNAVGSMVVFVDGKEEKESYRKFKIRTKSTPDDFAMLREVLSRRFHSSGKNANSTTLPHLIIIDGGKGQLSATFSLLREMNISIPIIGLAKKHEEIFLPEVNNGKLSFRKKTFARQSEGKFLIQRIRDESHRFAINYHRKLRSIGQNRSVLDDIPGIGPVVKRKLIQAFGNVEAISKASSKEIQEIIRNRRTVENIRKLLND